MMSYFLVVDGVPETTYASEEECIQSFLDKRQEIFMDLLGYCQEVVEEQEDSAYCINFYTQDRNLPVSYPSLRRQLEILCIDSE